MRVGANLSAAQTRAVELDAINVIDGSGVPLFFSKLYDESKKGSRVTSEQAELLWKYLETLPGSKFQRAQFGREHVGSILDVVLVPLREAAAHAAGVLGQVLNHNTNKVVHEILFYIVSYFNEVALAEPKDMVGFVRKCGIDLAKYIDTLLSIKPLDTSRVKPAAGLKKSPEAVLTWLSGLLRSNYLVVHEVFGALLGSTMVNLSYKIHGLCGTFMKDVNETLTPLSKLKEIAGNLSKMDAVPKENQQRLQTALKQVAVLEAERPVGTIEPWMLASILTQMYYDEPINRGIAKLMVQDRMGKSMRAFMLEFDQTLSLIKTEIWLSIMALAASGESKVSIKEYITQYVSIAGRSWLWGNDSTDSDSDDEEEERRKASKGKEEATAEDTAFEARRTARRAEQAKIEHLKHLAKMKKERQNAIEEAMRNDPDNPYNPLLNSDDKFQAARSRVNKRLQELIEEVTVEMTGLEQTRQVVQRSNTETRLIAGNTAIAAFRGTPEQRKTIQDALGMIDALQSENLQVVEERIAPLRFKLDVHVEILRALERREEELNGRVFRTSTKLGLFLVIVAGVFALLYFIHKTNTDWIGAVNTSLTAVKERAEATYTRGLVNLWENIWKQQYMAERAKALLGNYTPLRWLEKYDMSADILEQTASEGIRRLSTFASEIGTPVEATRSALLGIINRYNEFAAPYINGLTSLLTETNVHLNKLAEAGHTLENSLDYQKVSALKDLITKALGDYKNVLGMSNSGRFTFDALLGQISAANHAMQEALQMLQIKMMTGRLPEAVNMYSSILSKFFSAPKDLAVAAGGAVVAAAGKFFAWRKTQTPQPMDLSPYGMFNVMSAGKSQDWLNVFKDMGKGTIAITVATAAIPLLLFFHVSNLFARLYHAGGDPTVVTTRFFFDAVAGLTVIWVAVFQVIETASLGTYNMNWGFYGMIVGLLALAMPNLAIWMKLKEMIDKKRQGTATTTPSASAHPPPNPVPAINATERTTPALAIEPTRVNPDIFVLPQQQQQLRQIEPPSIDPQELKAVSDQWLEALKKQSRPKVEVVDDDDENFKLERQFVACVVCGDEACLMCSHCYGKSYCESDCGKFDWSHQHGGHLSFTKK